MPFVNLMKTNLLQEQVRLTSRWEAEVVAFEYFPSHSSQGVWVAEEAVLALS